MSSNLVAQSKHRYSLNSVMDKDIIEQVSASEAKAKTILESARQEALEIIDDAKRIAANDSDIAIGKAHDKLIRDYREKEREIKHKLVELEQSIESEASSIRVNLESRIQSVASKLAKQTTEKWQY